MALPIPKIDDLSYQQIRSILLNELPLISRDYTDHNASDPGIALLELLSAMGESIIYRCDQISPEVERNFLKMVLDRPEPVTATIVFYRGKKSVPLAALPTGVDFEDAGLGEKMSYDSGTGLLSFDGAMTELNRQRLSALSADSLYEAAVTALFEATNKVIVIHAGTVITGADAAVGRAVPDAGGTLFETIGEVEIPAMTNSVTATARHLAVWEGSQSLGTGSGEPDQYFDLVLPKGSLPLLLDPARQGSLAYDPNPLITVGAETWCYASDLLDAVETDAVFTVEWLPRRVSAEEQAYRFRFGNGVNGRIPADGEPVVCLRYQQVADRYVQVTANCLDTIESLREPLLPDAVPAGLVSGVTYDATRELLLLTGGLSAVDWATLRGLVPADTTYLRTYQGAVDNLFEQSALFVNNPHPARGGRYLFGAHTAAEEGLGTLFDPDRAITARDFQFMARKGFNGSSGLKALKVARAHARRTDDLGGVTVIVVPERASISDWWPTPTLDLLNAVYQFIDERRVITTRVLVQAPVYQEITLYLSIKSKLHADPVELAGAVQKTVRRRFDALDGGIDGTGWPLGRGVYRSELFQLLKEINGVDQIESVRIGNNVDNALFNLSPLTFPKIVGELCIGGRTWPLDPTVPIT